MYNSSGAYQTSCLFVFDKSAGFSGQSSVTSYAAWGLNGFTFVPLQNVGTPVVNSIWLTAKESGSGSVIKFYQYTGPLPGNLTTMPYSEQQTDAYSPPADAIQPDFTSLSMGDGRMMDGYFKNGVAHFVFPEDYSGYSAIRYYRVNLPALTGSYAQIYKVTAPALDYSWPSVVDFGTSATDQSSLVGFQCVGNQTNPEFRAKYYDNSFATEPSIQVVAGANSLASCQNYPHRWGDYTSAVRRPGGSNTNVWVFGSYGAADGQMVNRIAEIGSSGVFTDDITTVQNTSRIFPNPANEKVTFLFQSGYVKDADYVVVNMAGEEILSGQLGTMQAGEKEITLETTELKAGMYHIRIVSKRSNFVFTGSFGVFH
jgi:hypothetical protein